MLRISLLTERDRCSRTHVLVRMLVKHLLELVTSNSAVVHQHMIMGRSRCTLNCTMGTQIEIILEGMGNILLNQRARHRITIFIGRWGTVREEPNVMTLLGHHHRKFDL